MEANNTFNVEKRLINQRLDKLENDVKDIKRAFPKSEFGEIDYQGHREYHKNLMDAAQAEKAFWDDLKTDLVKKGTWFGLLILAGLILNGLLWKIGLLKT